MFKNYVIYFFQKLISDNINGYIYYKTNKTKYYESKINNKC